MVQLSLLFNSARLRLLIHKEQQIALKYSKTEHHTVPRPYGKRFLAETPSPAGREFPRPATPDAASNAHPNSNSMLSPGALRGTCSPIRVVPRLGLQLTRQGYHRDKGSAPSASRFAELGESVQPFLFRHGAGARGTRYNFLLSSGG